MTDPIAHIQNWLSGYETPRVQAVREMDARFWSIITKPGPLTTEEQEYLDRVEREGATK